MELSYYFYTQLKKREDIDDFLIGLMNGIVDNENKLKINRHEESEEGEGDTLEFSCKFFSVSTNLHYVKDTSEEYHMKINFCLWIYIYRDGKEKFMEFMGKLLSETKGGAILIEENSSTVLERRNDTLIVNNYFFDGDFSNLGIEYLNGIYKTFYFDININSCMDDLKSKTIYIVKECIGEQSYTLIEDEDTPYAFEISSDYFKAFIHLPKRNKENVFETMDSSISIIYANNDYSRLKIMTNFLKGILKEFEGNCQLRVSKGYLIKDCKEYVLMERKDDTIIVNENADEKNLFYEIGIPYIERTIEVE
ncbi:MAG: hypothetical protein ABF685_13515 [Clostridium saccharoperbutylacetonicum]